MESLTSNPEMMKQAQHIWSMLDDMANNDPAAYRKFIDKHVSEGKEAMKPPKPHMCVMTSVLKGSEHKVLYMNIVGWNRIPSAKTDEDPIPVMGGTLYKESDASGSHQLITLAFNEQTLQAYGIDSGKHEERNMLINLAIDYVEDQQRIKLSRTYTLFPKKTLFKGNLDMVISSLKQKVKAEDDQFEESLSEIEKTFGPMAEGCKDTLMSQLSNISSSDKSPIQTHVTNQPEIRLEKGTANKPAPVIEEVSSTRLPVHEPEHELREIKDINGQLAKYQIIVQLPGVQTVTECDLDISTNDLHLETAGRYELSMTFPIQVDPDTVHAKFNKKKSSLSITMSIIGNTS